MSEKCFLFTEDEMREIETGKAYFVRAGPGDPELLALKACRLLQIGDVILHDSLRRNHQNSEE